MLMFEVGRAFLLFPGDAQWGTWRAAMHDDEWRSLLERTTLYKVGHHGSHNATPRDFIEKLIAPRTQEGAKRLEDFAAMVSTKPVKIWQYIPKADLLSRLDELTDYVARSDKAPVGSGVFAPNRDMYIDARSRS